MQKPCRQVQHAFMIKAKKKHVNIINAVHVLVRTHTRTRTRTYTPANSTEYISLEPELRIGCLSFLLLFSIFLECIARAIKQEKEIKTNRNWML